MSINENLKTSTGVDISELRARSQKLFEASKEDTSNSNNELREGISSLLA